MPTKIVYNYGEMKSAVAKMRTIASRYKEAGSAFVSGFLAATQEWEGESKEKMSRLISGDVNEMLTVEIPEYVNGLATLLEQNIEQMQKADEQIAESIPDQLS